MVRFNRRQFAVAAAGLGVLAAVPGRVRAEPDPSRFLVAAPVVAPSDIAATATGQIVTPDGRIYDAYIPAATKPGQYFHYTCEFDASWAVMQTFGRNPTLEDQLGCIGQDTRIEPYYQETANGVLVYGGDITTAFSGDYRTNFLARCTGAAMRDAFLCQGLTADPVRDRPGIETALRNGALVWIKTAVDFLDWVPVTWITPEGLQLKGVLGNDHAVVVIGFNQSGVVIRDVLGPTSTNAARPYEYEVAWDRFLTVWAAQDFDGLAVKPASGTTAAELISSLP